MKINSIERRFKLLILLPLALEVCFVIALVCIVKEAEEEARRQERVKSILLKIERLWSTPVQFQRSMLGYVQTKNKGYLEKFQKTNREAHQTIDELKKLSEGDSTKTRLLTEVEQCANKAVEVLEPLTKDEEASEDALILRLQSLSHEFYPLANHAQKQLQLLRDEEKKSETSVSQFQSAASAKIYLLIAVALLVLAIAVRIGWMMIMDTVSRVKTLTVNTEKLAAGEALSPPLAGADELKELDLFFRKMADDLEEAARKERAIVENAVDIICSLDEEMRFAKVSAACATVLGYQPDELLGYYAVEFIAKKDAAVALEAFRYLMESGRENEIELRLVRKDGRELYSLWSAYWSRAERRMFCVIHDITERKAAEEALKASEARVRNIIENMPVGLVLMDHDGIIRDINPSMETLFGHGVEALVGHHVVKLFPADERTDEATFSNELFKKAIGHIYERQAVRADGSTFPIHISITEMEFAEGQRLLGIILDVTERHEIERFKNEFLGVVSHELRNPLTAIRGSLKLMLAGALGPQSEQAQKAITIAERSATRLIGLVNDLLDIEKLEAGKLEMGFELVPIGPVLEGAVESVKPFGDQHEVRIEWADSDEKAFIDGDRIVQVLINLLSNAIKYSPKGSAVVLSTVPHSSELEVRVTDTGRGIPESHLGALFQRFKQVERTDATKKGGTGLGLAICKAIIEQHGGTIGVESELGKGSTFWFRVPNCESKDGTRGEIVKDVPDEKERERISVAHEIV